MNIIITFVLIAMAEFTELYKIILETRMWFECNFSEWNK